MDVPYESTGRVNQKARTRETLIASTRELLAHGVLPTMERAANAAAQTLAKTAGDRLVYPVEANEVFLKVSAEEAAALRAQGFDFYDWGVGEMRLVTSWDQQGEAVEKLATAIRAL